MNVGTVGWIHQAHHGMIDITGKVKSLRNAGFSFAKVGNGRDLGEIIAIDFSLAVCWNVNPNMSLNFATGKGADSNAIDIEGVIFCEGRNIATMTAICLKFPAMIAAAYSIAFNPSVAERNTTMRTDISQGKDLSILAPPY
jgi:hypothetical protein